MSDNSITLDAVEEKKDRSPGAVRQFFIGLLPRLAWRRDGLSKNINAQVSKAESLEEAHHRQTKYLNALHDTALEMVSRLDVKDLLQTVIARATALVGSEHGFIYLLEPGESEMQMLIGVGAYADLVGSHSKRGTGLAGLVWETGQTMAVDDYRTWERCLEDPHRDYFHGLVGVPLKSGDRVTGVIGLAYVEEGRRFGEAEVDALNRFAALVSLALDNATLVQQIQKDLGWQKTLYRASEMIGRATTIESVTRGAAELLPLLEMSACTIAVIIEVDPAGNPIRTNLYTVTFNNDEFMFLPTAIGKTISGWMPSDPNYYSQSRTTVFPNLEDRTTAYPPENYKPRGSIEFMLRQGMRGAVSLALGAHGRKIGYLTFCGPRRLSRPPQEYVEQLKNIIDLVATAVDNVQLSQQTQRELVERQRAERFLDSVVENLPITLFAKDARELRFVRWNKAGEELVGLPRAEILGKNDNSLFVSQDQQVLSSKKLVEIAEEVIETREKGQRIMHTRKFPILDEAGNPQFLLGISEDITERKHVEAALTSANDNLKQLVSALEQRTSDITLLSQMANMLQRCHTVEEAYPVVVQFLQDMFPAQSGALYLMNASRNFLELSAFWGDLQFEQTERTMGPEDCWALRLERAYQTDEAHNALRCRHIKQAAVTTHQHLCLPLRAHSETLGILYLQTSADLALSRPEDPKAQLAVTVADQVGLAVANLRLRETLRRQSVRDPLTDLYNRRYMEETFERELHRAGRHQQQVGVVMIDLDNFKKFNDAFGHGAGDVLLRELGALLNARVRGGDIACRYGGEEFTLILPDATLEQTLMRANQIREDAKQLKVQYHGQTLGGVTLSVGVAVFPTHGMTVDPLLHAADVALYRAKNLGKDRAVAAESV